MQSVSPASPSVAAQAYAQSAPPVRKDPPAAKPVISRSVEAADLTDKLRAQSDRADKIQRDQQNADQARESARRGQRVDVRA